MKSVKKLVSLLLCMAMMLCCLGGAVAEDKAVKIGVLVSDATSAEALAFRAYYTDYIQTVYNVEFIYSDELADAAAEKTAIETMVANNCLGIISFSSFDRPAQIEQCESEEVYYAVATGTLTDDQYEAAKEYEYYVGAIGPDLATEFATGYDMAMYFLEQGKTQFGLFGGAIPYYTEMHIYRAAGMLTAMIDKGGEGANYRGATNMGEVVGKIYEDGCQIHTGEIGSNALVSYVGGYTMDDAWFGECAAAVNAEGLEVMLAVGNGSDFFAAAKPEGVQIGSVDAYAPSYGEAMKAGSLNYLAGKFSSSIGPIFVAVLSAIEGAPIRNEEGNALALSQGYWIADSAELFDTYYAVDSSVTDPAYTKDMLDKLIGADYASFAAFVSAYSFDEILAQK